MATGPRQIVPVLTPGELEAIAPLAPAAHLTYHNGPVLTAVQVVTIFWGAAWGQPAQSGLIPSLNQFFDFILTSSLMDLLAEYSVPGQAIGHGSRINTVTITTSEPGTAQPGGGRVVTDAQIQQALQGWIADGTAPQTTSNTLYFVYLPPGVTSTGFGQQSCPTNGPGYCGYHSAINGVFYAVEPFLPCTGCTFGNSQSLDSLTKVSSHELCEAITDPALNAWWDDNGGNEIGDICNSTQQQLGGFTIQEEWSNQCNACLIQPGGPGGNWSFAGNTAGFGHGINDGRPFWIGDFNGDGRADVLFYYPGDDNWWLGSHDGNQLVWSFAGNTAGFGHGINDGRPFWIGNFSRADRAQVLFYYPGDGNWWLGSHDGNQLQWSYAGNTLGANPGDPNFGQVWDGRPFWIGDFNGDGRADVLFYYPGDDNWWLGSHDGNQLVWSFAGNTAGFGHGINDGRPFWTGNFSRADRAQVLFYYPGDDNWWLGSHDGNQLVWSFAGNTAGFGHGINDGRPFWIGDFNGDGRADVLFYYPGDDNWWLGSHDGNQLVWSFAGNTAGFGHGINDGRPFWIGDFNGDGRADVLFYYPGDDNWWRGSHDGNQLQWTFTGNTCGFGHGINDGRPFWIGNVSRADRAQVLFYYPGDDNWWLGTHDM